MNNLWLKIGCFLSGWEYKLLNNCTETSKSKLRKFTSALLIIIIMWAIIGYKFSFKYFHLGAFQSFLVAICFMIVVVQIERQIILSIGKSRWIILIRLLIALTMSVIGSVIFDQIIFKDDIEKKMVQIVDDQVNIQLPKRISIIDKKIYDNSSTITELENKQKILYAEIAAAPFITMTTSSTRVSRTRDSLLNNETTTNQTLAPNPKTKEVDMNSTYLDELRKKQEDYMQKKLAAETILRNELKSKQGFLEELNAMYQILGEAFTARLFYGVLFTLLLLLESLVVISKVIDKECDYELLVMHQLNQKEKQINGLAK